MDMIILPVVLASSVFLIKLASLAALFVYVSSA
jgi:hypothetical protein